MKFLTAYYNPCKYKSKKYNYLKFRKDIEDQNLELITLEISNTDDYEIHDSYKFKGDPFLWQKEFLLSKALDIFPNEEKFTWLDCDIIFENKKWHEGLENKLEDYDVIQLFEDVNFLRKNKTIEKKFKSCIFEYHNNDMFKRGYPNQGHPGFAWAAKRKYVNFYKKNFSFSGDVVFCSSLIKDFWIINSWKIPFKLKEDILDWCVLNNSNLKLTNLSGSINHLYHGSWKDRQYPSRVSIINKYKEIEVDDFLKCKNEKVRLDFINFMKKRHEDGIYFL